MEDSKMREQDFINFLNADPNITSQDNIRGRVRYAKMAEAILGMSLDVVVATDDLMYESLVELRKHENILRGHMQNSVRKYYKLCNGKDFPHLRDYHSAKHP
jgi:hypothetical protein